MPEIPSWIIPARTTAPYLQGVNLGLQAAQVEQQAAYRQAQIFAEAQKEAVAAELAQQRMDLQQQQFLEQVGISREELELRRMVDQAKIEEALSRRAAQQEYEGRVAAGEDPMDVLMQLAPRMGDQTAQAAAIRAQMQAAKNIQAPQTFDLGGGVKGVWNPQSGAFQLLPQDKPVLTEKERLLNMREAQKMVNALYESNPTLARKAVEKRTEDEKRTAESIKFWEDQLESLKRMKVGTAQPVLRWNSKIGAYEPSATATTGATIRQTALPGGVSPTIPSGLTTADYPAWPTQEGEAPIPTMPEQVVPRLPRTGTWLSRIGLAPQQGVQRISEQLPVLAQQGLQTAFGRAFADIEEGIAGLADIPTAGLLDLRNKVKDLREAILEYQEPDAATE